jgi:hypothetical protein
MANEELVGQLRALLCRPVKLGGLEMRVALFMADNPVFFGLETDKKQKKSEVRLNRLDRVVSDKEAVRRIEAEPSLYKLHVSGCDKLSNATFEYMGTRAVELRLDACRGVSNLTLTGVACGEDSRLERLTVENNAVVTPAVLNFLVNTRLTRLVFNNCAQFSLRALGDEGATLPAQCASKRAFNAVVAMKRACTVFRKKARFATLHQRAGMVIVLQEDGLPDVCFRLTPGYCDMDAACVVL